MTSVLKVCINLLAASFLVGSLQGCVSDPALNKALGLSSVPASKQAYAAKYKKSPVKINKKTKRGKKKKAKTQSMNNNRATEAVIENLYNVGLAGVDGCINRGNPNYCMQYQNANSNLISYCVRGNALACQYRKMLYQNYTFMQIRG